MLTAVKLPPATTRLLVGSLCMCACTVPLFIGGTEDMTGGVEGSEATGDEAPTSSSADDGLTGGAIPASSTTTTTGGEDPASESSSDPESDMPGEDGPKCQLPDAACDDGAGDLEHAIGLNCGHFKALGPMTFAGPPESRGVTTGLGAGSTFTPRIGMHAVVVSTGVAAHTAMSAEQVEDTTDCSQVGLPCPSTDFPEQYDLETLPAPLSASVCDPQGGGDCSDTVDDQWLGDPRLAHDYTELRFSAEVPGNTVAVSMAIAFLTAERPTRFPSVYNDFLIVWLDSEQWTGNIAIHPEQASPVAANALDFEHFQDPALADFAFAQHAATDWFRISAAVAPGDTITLVVALFDESDGSADSAVLLDDLRWDCDAVSRP